MGVLENSYTKKGLCFNLCLREKSLSFGSKIQKHEENDFTIPDVFFELKRKISIHT